MPQPNRIYIIKIRILQLRYGGSPERTSVRILVKRFSIGKSAYNSVYTGKQGERFSLLIILFFLLK